MDEAGLTGAGHKLSRSIHSAKEIPMHKNVGSATALEIVVVLPPLSRFGGNATRTSGAVLVLSDPGFEVWRRWGQTATSSSALCVVSPFSSRQILALCCLFGQPIWGLRPEPGGP